MTRNVAVVLLNFDTLSMLLGLPEGQRVVRAEYAIEWDGLRVLIEGKGLPEIPYGAPAMSVRPTFREVKRLEVDWDVSNG
jgi:hypothetical protein